MNDTETMINTLRSGPWVNASTNTGKTALHVAAEKGDATTVAHLLSYGAYPRIKDRTGKTPIDVARDRNSIAIIAILAGIKLT
jgi:ankyrin repeat protein